MRLLKLHISLLRILNHNVLLGMVSIITPSVIQVQPLKFDPVNNNDEIASDWKIVGSYIQNAYDSSQ